MDVLSRGSLDTACTSTTSTDLMLRKWAFRAELDSPPPENPSEITWISPKGYWCWVVVCRGGGGGC